jgi:Sulfotransferase domain
MWASHYTGIEATFPPHDILYIRYEDLKNVSRRINVMAKVAEFLKVQVPRERLECAYVLSESKKAHRHIDREREMTKDIAYTQQLACRMWAKFGVYAHRHGYKPWGGYNCSGYAPIPEVNVGPQGEYNRKWVSPGKKLIDFGGHDGSGLPLVAESMMDQKKSLRSDPIPSAREGQESRRSKKAPSFVRKVLKSTTPMYGMTIEEASAVEGVGKVGISKPLWD